MKNTALYVCLVSALCAAGIASAKDKKTKPTENPKDEIQVAGHVNVTGGAITSFLVTPHYSSLYLYAERGPGNPIMLLDITKPDQPAVLGDMASTNGESLSMVAGTAALAVSSQAPAATTTSSAAPQSIRIMDFSDPRNPKVAREFTGVTAMARDDHRGLVFIANAGGIWILRQKLALDPAVEKAYSDYVFYSH